MHMRKLQYTLIQNRRNRDKRQVINKEQPWRERCQPKTSLMVKFNDNLNSVVSRDRIDIEAKNKETENPDWDSNSESMSSIYLLNCIMLIENYNGTMSVSVTSFAGALDVQSNSGI